MIGSEITINGISKNFGNISVLNNINLTIKKGEFFSLLGPSGCGKTTLLRIIGGFEDPNPGGSLLIDGEPVLHLPPNKRHVNTVFQNYALFPHLTVFENIAFPLRLKKIGGSQLKDQVNHYLEMVKLQKEARKLPAKLSGGQRQRVAIARALINEPSVLLLDEPLSALDAKLRQHMLIELDAIHDKVGITFIYVTHDQQEALSVSDRVAILDQGDILQTASPKEIYDRPANLFVTKFIGESNIIPVMVNERLAGNNYKVSLPSGNTAISHSLLDLELGSSANMIVRPESISLTDEKPPHEDDLYCIQGTLYEIIYGGFHSKFFLKTESGLTLKAYRPHIRGGNNSLKASYDEKAYISWYAEDTYLLKDESEQN